MPLTRHLLLRAAPWLPLSKCWVGCPRRCRVVRGPRQRPEGQGTRDAARTGLGPGRLQKEAPGLQDEAAAGGGWEKQCEKIVVGKAGTGRILGDGLSLCLTCFKRRRAMPASSSSAHDSVSSSCDPAAIVEKSPSVSRSESCAAAKAVRHRAPAMATAAAASSAECALAEAAASRSLLAARSKTSASPAWRVALSADATARATARAASPAQPAADRQRRMQASP